MKSNSREGNASFASVDHSGPPTMLSASSPSPLSKQVGLGDGVGFGVDFLPEQVGGDLLAVLRSEFVQCFFGHRQHAAGAAGAVIKQIGARVDLVGDRHEDQLRHKLDGIARRPVFACFFVVCLVEAADKFLEDGAHGVVVEARMIHRTVAVQHRAWDRD